MKRIILLAGSALLATLAASVPCMADTSPGNEFRIGSETVFFREKADDVSGPYVPPGVTLAVNNTETLYFAYIRQLAWHFEVELAMGVPPKTKTEGRGPATLGSVPYDGQVVSTARWLSPTLLINYVFLDDTWNWHPYLGVGVNYTAFYERRSTPQGDAALGGPSRLSLTSSVGPAATMGMSYRIAPNWNLTASYSISQVKTHLTADTAGVERSTNISFGPQALVFAVGYSF